MDKRVGNETFFLHQRTNSVFIIEFLNVYGKALLVSHDFHNPRHNCKIVVIQGKENIDVIREAGVPVQVDRNSADNEILQFSLMKFPQYGLIIGHGCMVRRSSIDEKFWRWLPR